MQLQKEQEIWGIMDVYDTIVAIIQANNGSIDGRTTIQKLAYFSKIKIPSLDVGTFRHYFYGPFSREVAMGLEDMTGFSFLEERVVPGYQYEGYSYSLMKDSKKMSDAVSNQYRKESKIISEIVHTCNDFCQLKAKTLSYAAKAYYILANTEKGRKRGITTDDLEKVGKEFDWNISKSDAEIGIELLKKLKFVREVS